MPTEQNGAGGQDTTLQGSLNHSGRQKKKRAKAEILAPILTVTLGKSGKLLLLIEKIPFHL